MAKADSCNELDGCVFAVGGLIDTGSLSLQDGLQLNQFGINNNSPNLAISSEREQAHR